MATLTQHSAPGEGIHSSSGRAPTSDHDDLDTLIRISQAVVRQRERPALVKALAAAIEGVLPVERLAVTIIDSGCAETTIYAVPGGQKIDREPAWYTSLSEWVASNRQAMVLSSPEDLQARFPGNYQSLLDEGIGAVVILPLVVDDRCLGTLGLMASAKGAWNSPSPRWLDAIGTSVAAALENCLAYEQAQSLGDELKALLDVNVAVGRHLERDELFGAVAACLRNLFETDRFGIELPIEGDRLQGHLLTPSAGKSAPTRVKVLPSRGTACNWVLQNRRWLVGATRDELRDRFPLTFDVMSKEGMESLCAIPLVSEERARGVLFFMAARRAAYGNIRRGLLEQVAAAMAVALDDCLAHEEVRTLRDRLAAENVYLQEEIRSEHNFEEIVGRSPALAAVLAEVEHVAPTDTSVLITGETGTGKELVARAIHSHSRRRDKPLIKVNCAALPPGLVESELFGHEKGAFTGAITRRIGRFELANGGTIFLDEIGDLPADAQVKLLRVLQEREFERVGGETATRVDVRVVAATNRDLLKSVREQKFREDLFYRLNVFPVRVPPLRERATDIPMLVHFLVSKFAERSGKRVKAVSPKTMERLLAYSWPGNVRELENVLERAVILSSGPTLEIDPVILPVTEAPASDDHHASLEDVQRSHIREVLDKTNWVIEGASGAACILGLHPNTLRSRMKKLGLLRPSSA